MKSFVLKSIVLFSMTLPLISYAVNSGDCGAGTVTAIRHNVTSGTESFDHVVMAWDSNHTPGSQWYNGVIIRNSTVSNAVRVAFLSGTKVRFLSSNGQCPNVDQAIECKSTDVCYSFPIPY